MSDIIDNEVRENIARQEDGSQSIRERMRAMYGENKPIEGEYDASVSARCSNGTFVGKSEGDIAVYRGIPFAQPPVGELRWKRPMPALDDDGVYQAYYNGKTPIQTEWYSEQASYYPQGEDCLYLNIWLNTACEDRGKPVMVFLHGGSYGWGGTADPLYDGANFVAAEQDIILVTVGYRIGLTGFIDLSYLEGGDEYPDAPNLGILDQIEALRWVQRNISAFGGDPDNVTVFGESAGGGSVSLLPIIPEASGLFRRVIAESGSVALTFSKDECWDFTNRLIKATSARKVSDLLSLSEEQLMRINESLNMYNNFPQRDGRLIPFNPYKAYKSGVTADLDIMIGTNSDEINYWVGEIGGIVPFRFSIPVKFENDMRMLKKEDKKRVKEFMSRMKGHKIWRMAEFYNEIMFRLPAIRQAEHHSNRGGRAFMYYWIEPSTLRFRGACHAVELAYVFNNPNETIFTGSAPDEELSRKVTSMWAQFARSGDPSIEGLEWSRYDAEERLTMVISKEPKLKKDILGGQRRLLTPLLRYMINPSYATLDYNVPFVRKAVGIAAGAAALTIAAGIVLIKHVAGRKNKE